MNILVHECPDHDGSATPYIESWWGNCDAVYMLLHAVTTVDKQAMHTNAGFALADHHNVLQSHL